MGNGTWVGPNGWPVIGVVAFIAALAWWLRREPNHAPSTVTILWRGFWWRYFPQLMGYLMVSREGGRGAEPEMIEDEPEPLSSAPELHMNAPEPCSSGSSEPFALALNADEVAAVARMIEHNKTAAKPSKSSAIHAGFGVSRGGSQLYQRASVIYDAFFGQPEPAVETPVAGRRTHARFAHSVKE